MTGFGKSVLQLSTKTITIEIKTLNSKNLDINCRLPSQYREKELAMRNQISHQLQRGKVDFSFYVEVTGEENTTQINQPIVRDYIKQLQGIADIQDTLAFLKISVRLPDALKTVRDEIDDDEFNSIKRGLDEALSKVDTYRIKEGVALEKDINTRITNISSLLEDVVLIDPERLDKIRIRLEKAIADLKEDVDANRFEQELIYYIEKYDINEEKVRLKNHLVYFIDCLKLPESNGKKLGFICQEIGREINTIGSKSNYAPMQKLVIQMKDELEKVKEATF